MRLELFIGALATFLSAGIVRAQLATEPSTPANGIIVSNVTQTEMTIGWSSGDGGRRIVVMTYTDWFSLTPPSDGSGYTASSVWASGSATSSWNYVVYNGTGNQVTVTNLSANTKYTIGVFEYNGTNTSANYNTTNDTNNPRIVMSAPNKPTSPSNYLTFSSVQPDQLTLDWANGNGDRRIVAVKASAPVDQVPTDNVWYTANPWLGASSTVGPFASSNWVVFNGGFIGSTSGNVTVTNLSPATTYHFQIFEYNVSGYGGQANYSYMTSGATISKTTLEYSPGTQAKDLNVTSRTATSISLAWTNGDGTSRLILAKEGTSVDGLPDDATTYTANNSFATGTEIGTANYVVYNGTGSSTTISGLKANTKYTFQIFEYRGSGVTTNYNTSTESANPFTANSSTEPVTQASNVLFSNITPTQMQLSWSSGSGERRVVVARQGQAVSTDPSDGQSYTANASFGSGSQLGSGNFVVYDGTGNSTTVSNLTSDATYYFRVYEYNNSIETNYLTASGAGNPVSRQTLVAEPTGQASSLTLTGRTSSSISAQYNAATGGASGYVVIRKQGGTPLFTPVDGTVYLTGASVAGETIAYSGASLNFSDNSLTALTDYYYTVYAFNGSGENVNYNLSSPLQNHFLTIAAEPAQQPSTMGFSNITTSSFDLSFTAPSQTPTGYLAVRRLGASPTAAPADEVVYTIGTTIGDGEVVYNGGATTFSQASLTANTNYFYKIFSYNGSGTEINYALASPLTGNMTTLAPEPSNQPTGVGFSGITSSSATVGFTAPIGGAQAYVAFRREGTAPTATPADRNTYSTGETVGDAVVAYAGASLSFVDTGLAAGTNYYYSVFAYNGSTLATNYNPSISSNQGSVVTVSAAPVLGTASSVTTSSFALSWSAVKGATSYAVEISSDNFSSILLPYQGKTTTSTSMTVDQLLPGVTYQARVAALNASGRSANSNVISQITIPAAPLLDAPKSVTQTSFVVSWSAVTGASEYLLDVSQDDFVTTLAKYTGASVTSTSASVDAIAGNSYQIRVKAKNNAGTSANSNSQTQRTVPATPVALDATNTNSSSFVAKWQTSTGADSYQLDVATDINFVTYVTGYQSKPITSGILQESVTNLAASTDYFYRVRAVNTAGISPSSGVILIRTFDGGTGNQPLSIAASSSNSQTLQSQSGISLEAIVTGGTGPFTVVLNYRAISARDFQQSPTSVNQSGNYFSTVASSMADEIGLEYFFSVTDATKLNKESERRRIYRAFDAASAPAIPTLSSGGKVENYRIFSVPYALKDPNIASIFSSLGQYDKSRWRLVRYQNGDNVDYATGSLRWSKAKDIGSTPRSPSLYRSVKQCLHPFHQRLRFNCNSRKGGIR